MGVAGTMEYLSELLSSGKKKKKKQLNTVAVKIRMDCQGCALKVKNALSAVKGKPNSFFLFNLFIFTLYINLNKISYILHSRSMINIIMS